jgi:hypothetical protein
LIGKPEWKRPQRDIDIDGMIILEWILGKQSGKVRTGFICLRIEANGGLL